MSDLFLAYLKNACEFAFQRPIEGKDLIEELQQEKILLTLATMPDVMRLSAEAKTIVANDVTRIQRLRTLAHQIVARSGGVARVIKGSNHSRLYPESVLRYEGDLDLLFFDESDYVSCLRELFATGFVQRASHLIRAKDGGFFASTIMYKPNAQRVQGPESMVVELHLRGFPITPLSYLDMSTVEHLRLSSEVGRALTLIAEFVHRYAKFQRFTHRDVLDTLLIFSHVTLDMVEELNQAVSNNHLWVSVALLRSHFSAIHWVKLPESLSALFAESAFTDAPENFDLFEHQAWPFCQSQGISRAGYDFQHLAYGRIYPTNGQPTSLTPFEIGACFAQGVPVAIRLDEKKKGNSILDTCMILAGPLQDRKIIHQRIGDDSPIAPQ